MRLLGLGAEYRKLWTASTLSNLGDGVTLVAAPLLAASLTRDPALVAGLTFATMLPWLLFSLHSGVIVDRLDRRTVMVSVNVFRASVIGGLGVAVALGWTSLPLLYATFFLIGCGEVLFDNASTAILPSIVEKKDLEHANGRLFAAQLITNDFLGKPFGGFLFSAFAALPFLLNAGTFTAAAALLWSLGGSFKVAGVSAAETDAPPERASVWQDIREGLAWLYGNRLLFAMALMLGASNFTFSSIFATFVLYSQEILGLGNTGYGILLTALGVGGLLGSLVAERVTRLLGPGRAMFVVLLVEAGIHCVFALSGSYYVAGVALLVIGVNVVVWNVITISLRQEIVPDHLLGRVLSAYRLIGVGTGAIGALVGGLLAREFGLTAPFWFAAVLIALVAFASLPFVNNRTIALERDGT